MCVYGLVGLKTHCKVALVVRREGDGIRRYVHLGTGNYNELTARFYTDVGMLTARSDIAEDAAKIFNLLTGMSQFPKLDKLWMAPFGVQQRFLSLIERETAHAKRSSQGKAPGRRVKADGANRSSSIVAKMNSLVDPEIIQALYRASQAGVQIDLIVRGICCLRPGLPGVSDNIRVRSIVDRFLEHSRIYYFANNGDDEVYCGSADWMPRNFFHRVEVVFPVEEPALKSRVRDEILGVAWRDNVKARIILPDGTHCRPRRPANEPPVRSQQWLLDLATRARPMSTEADLRITRQAAPPDATWGEGGTRAVTATGADLVQRQAPLVVPSHPTDGLPGTVGDPVLQSLVNMLNTEVAVARPAAEPPAGADATGRVPDIAAGSGRSGLAPLLPAATPKPALETRPHTKHKPGKHKQGRAKGGAAAHRSKP